MELNLSLLRNLFEPLAKAAKGLQQVSLLQGTKAYGVHLGRIAVPARERSPRHSHQNFYFLQEDYLRDKQVGQSWAWTVWRPQIVIGEAIGANMNLLAALGVYAALRKEAGLPFSYPGGGRYVTEATDTRLMAHAFQWAATAATARNQIFNITNGDVLVCQDLWPTLADAFGIENGPAEPMSLAKEIPKQAETWAQIVRKYGLRAPADLYTFVNQSLVVADFVLACGINHPANSVVSGIKLRQAGFQECIDTEDMFVDWIKWYQERRLLPPRTAA
jgi:nucleoside-diphosphate-sugar epimerase